jgi:hypothetical protein
MHSLPGWLRNLVAESLLLLGSALAVMAWVYPEHRDIGILALTELPAEQRSQLDKLWSEARLGFESRLCAQIADTEQKTGSKCIDYAAWPAIAGDHSCSASDMLNTILHSNWILRVADVGARLDSALEAAKRPDQRANAVRDSDLQLTRIDPEYVTRAVSNDAHFLLARSDVAMSPEAYAQLALGKNSPLNSLGTYVWYHLRALAEANRIAAGKVSQNDYAAAARATLADEAFALHFLEDSFASGHITGTWGNSAVRKGTHDYYSEHGLAVETWDHRRFVALGDAYMQPEEAERVAATVRESLTQLAAALEGKLQVSEPPDAEVNAPDPFDVCTAMYFPAAAGTNGDLREVVPVIVQMPIPALAEGKGALPRFHSELGPFLGLATGITGVAETGGFATTQTAVTGDSGLDASFRIGYGVEGILNKNSDGLTFVDVGIRENSRTADHSVPGRSALALRARMPFWLVPGDLLIAAPVLAFTAPRTLTKIVVQAANGGLIPWQAGYATPVGRFQIVAGREVGVSLFGFIGTQSVLLPTPGVPPINVTQITLRSIRWDFPVIEWSLFRTFSSNQSSGLTVQFVTGFDRPVDWAVTSPAGAPQPHLQTMVNGGIRLVFDWRNYFH